MFALFDQYKLYFFIGLFVLNTTGSFYGGYHFHSLQDDYATLKQEKSVIKINNDNTNLAYNTGLKFESNITTLNNNYDKLNEGEYENENTINSTNVITPLWVRDIQNAMSSIPDARRSTNGPSSTPSIELIKETKAFEKCNAYILQLNTLINQINTFHENDLKNKGNSK